MGSSPAAHMAHIRKCSHVILVGTLSLAEKELGKGHMVQTELNYIREAIRIGKQNKIISLLLSGDYETAFPVDFLRYTTIEAFRDMGYLRCLQALIKYLLELEGSVEYDLLWQQFNKKHLHCFPAPRDSSVNLAQPGQSSPNSPNATRLGFFSAASNGAGQISPAIGQASASTTLPRPAASVLQTMPK